VHGFGAQPRPYWRGQREQPARQRTLETGSSWAPVNRARLVRRRRRSRHSCVVNRYRTHDSGRRRSYLSRWLRGRLHGIHPGHPRASKAPALVLEAQAAAHARCSPGLVPGSVMNRPEPKPPQARAPRRRRTRGGTTRPSDPQRVTASTDQPRLRRPRPARRDPDPTRDQQETAARSTTATRPGSPRRPRQ
jgi:hypothetical protein